MHAIGSTAHSQIILREGAYNGEILAGKPHGQGIYKKRNGDYQSGVWVEGNFLYGKVQMSTAYGKYQGSFLGGCMHGRGEYICSDGTSFFVGEFDKDHFSIGFVRVSNEDGIYVGEMKDEMKDGCGVFIWNDGSFMRGEWEKGVLRKGRAKIITGKGVFEGDVKNGKREGLGAYYYYDGSWKKGIWKEGKFLSGEMRIYTPEGYREEGKIINGEKWGKWEITSPDGNCTIQTFPGR